VKVSDHMCIVSLIIYLIPLFCCLLLIRFVLLLLRSIFESITNHSESECCGDAVAALSKHSLQHSSTCSRKFFSYPRTVRPVDYLCGKFARTPFFSNDATHSCCWNKFRRRHELLL